MMFQKSILRDESEIRQTIEIHEAINVFTPPIVGIVWDEHGVSILTEAMTPLELFAAGASVFDDTEVASDFPTPPRVWNLDQPKTVIKFIRSLFQLVAGLHDLDICHRDIKPQNVVVDLHGAPRLIDLELCFKAKDMKLTVNNYGTKGFLPPEQVQNLTGKPVTKMIKYLYICRAIFGQWL